MKRLVLVALLVALAGAAALAAEPVTVSVTSRPLWTSTAVTLSVGQHVRIVATGDDIWTWGGGAEHGIAGYEPWSKPNTYDRFLFAGNHGEMIAYVGDDPYQGNWGNYYYDWYGEGDPRSGQNQWPGYLHVGEFAMAPEGFQWTADRGGLLWLGFNDDAQTKAVGDNVGSVVVQVYVNARPTAEAGPNQQVHWTETAHLDGTGSTDPDNDPLTYTWEMVARPGGSAAALDDPHSPTPSFTADAYGTYTVRLVVADPHQESEPDYVVVDTADTAPTADAGPDQVVPAGPGGVGTVSLDGSGSWDGDGDPILSYAWTWEGGSASGVSPEVSLPVGAHVITLVVSDGLLDSPPDTVRVQVNRAPVAEAGPGIQAQAGLGRRAKVALDGSGSFDPDGDPLTYTWTWSAGTASGVSPTVKLPQGWTNVKLVVNDGYADSDPDFVTVFVKGLTIILSGPQAGTIQQAIDSAQDWDTVGIGPGTYQGCLSFRGKQITLLGLGGANRTIIRGSSAIYGCPLVSFDQNETPAAVLDGFTLQGPQVASKGTGIYIHDSSPTIRNCVIKECVADEDGPPDSGGVGGAIWINGTLGRPQISNCLICSNTATSQYGCGGIYVCGGAEATVTNCTIANNYSNLGAAGLSVKAGSTVLLKDSVLWGNSPRDVEADADSSFTVTCTDIGERLWPGAGNISADPLFVRGTLGRYYLAGDSPCLDTGSAAASGAADLAIRTTLADGRPDGGRLDLGYHYPRTPVYIYSAYPAGSNGLAKSSFGPGEKVFVRVDYSVQGAEGELYKAKMIVKIGVKLFFWKAIQAPGDYTALVPCKAYYPAQPQTKKVVVKAKLLELGTGVVLGKDKVKTTVYVHP